MVFLRSSTSVSSSPSSLVRTMMQSVLAVLLVNLIINDGATTVVNGQTTQPRAGIPQNPPVIATCSDENSFEIFLQADSNPTDINVKLYQTIDNNIALDYTPTQALANTIVPISTLATNPDIASNGCVPYNEQYRLVVTDSGGNGITNYFVQVFLDGLLIIENSNAFTNSIQYQFLTPNERIVQPQTCHQVPDTELLEIKTYATLTDGASVGTVANGISVTVDVPGDSSFTFSDFVQGTLNIHRACVPIDKLLTITVNAGDQTAVTLITFDCDVFGIGETFRNSLLSSPQTPPVTDGRFTALPFTTILNFAMSSDKPSSEPSFYPTEIPSQLPSDGPTNLRSAEPSDEPSAVPSSSPSGAPSDVPSEKPSDALSAVPSGGPTSVMSEEPSGDGTGAPSSEPSAGPSAAASSEPSMQPSSVLSGAPSDVPSEKPSDATSAAPSGGPTSVMSVEPSGDGTGAPSSEPSAGPSAAESSEPSMQPSSALSGKPSAAPSNDGSSKPTDDMSAAPTSNPSGVPSAGPTGDMSIEPSGDGTGAPSPEPSAGPTAAESSEPSTQPSSVLSGKPSSAPTAEPSDAFSVEPSASPTFEFSLYPTSTRTVCDDIDPRLFDCKAYFRGVRGQGRLCQRRALGQRITNLCPSKCKRNLCTCRDQTIRFQIQGRPRTFTCQTPKLKQRDCKKKNINGFRIKNLCPVRCRNEANCI